MCRIARLVFFICFAFMGAWADVHPVGAAAGSPVASLQQVRYYCSAKYTRVVFDLDREVDYHVGRLDQDAAAGRPARIYVDLRDTLRSKDVGASTELKEGPVQTIRSGRYDSRTTRLVLDLRHAEDYNVFRLEQPFRIVLDLWWKKGERGGGSSRTGQGEKGSSGTAAPRLPLIVIDPGHGGKDPGASGRGGLHEKDVALSVARYVKTILEGRETAEVILTRDRDLFVPLERRAWIANSKDADLFVSIHANAHPNRGVHGMETYYLDNTTDRAAIRVAAMENDTPEKKTDQLSQILIDLRCNVNAWESNELAHTMQEALIQEVRHKGYRGTRDLGAKGALFYVLLGAHMPSVLVEVGFITNATEENRMKTVAYRKALAQGVALGITNYLQQRGLSGVLAKRDGG